MTQRSFISGTLGGLIKNKLMTVTLSRWNVPDFNSPPRRRTNNIYSKKDTTEKNPRTQMQLKQCSAAQRPRQTAFEGKMATC